MQMVGAVVMVYFIRYCYMGGSRMGDRTFCQLDLDSPVRKFLVKC